MPDNATSKSEGIDRLLLYPTFTFNSEDTDGLVPACRVESWQSFFRQWKREKSLVDQYPVTG